MSETLITDNWGNPKRLALALQQANDQLDALNKELASSNEANHQLTTELAAARQVAENNERDASAWLMVLGGMEAIKEADVHGDTPKDECLNSYVAAWIAMKKRAEKAEMAADRLEMLYRKCRKHHQGHQALIESNKIEKTKEGWEQWYAEHHQKTDAAIAKARGA